MSEALKLDAISRSFTQGPKTVEVLKGADLSVQPGEVVALVAPSGGGKSTLLQIAGLLDTPTAGTVAIEGTVFSGLDDSARTSARRRLLGFVYQFHHLLPFVYQFHHLLPDFSAEENLAIPLMTAGQDNAAAMTRAAELLDRVGLAERRTHQPAELSGGEQQRVAICRALANNPRVLLADEPTGNLDPETASRVFDMLLEVVRETGLAALIATHNHDLAGRMDRTVRLEGGVIRAG
jgi:lipoprotein-releasing system ATP-binding protein